MLLLLSILIFMGIQLMPGDALTAMMSPDTIINTSIDFETLRAELGLDQPIYKQYLRWLGNIFNGDFGRSFVDGLPIAEKLAIHLPGTLQLMGVSILFAGILGISLGFLSAIKQNTWLDYTNTTFGMLGISIPEFFFGMGAIVIFAIKLKWFPSGGNLPVLGEPTFGTFIKHITMPAIVLSLGLVAALMRQVRGSMLDVLNNDYIKTARIKGISEFRGIYKTRPEECVHAYHATACIQASAACCRLNSNRNSFFVERNGATHTAGS